MVSNLSLTKSKQAISKKTPKQNRGSKPRSLFFFFLIPYVITLKSLFSAALIVGNDSNYANLKAAQPWGPHSAVAAVMINVLEKVP